MSFSSGGIETASVLVALLLLGLSLWSLPLAYVRALSVLREARIAPWVALACVAAALCRWLLAPHDLATIFIGYKQTEQAATLLPLSHYGVGSTALYHALFGLFPVDHRTIIWANAILGVFTLPLLAAWTTRLLHDPRAGALVALLVALTPLFIRNDASEANSVPALWWLLSGLVLAEHHLSTGRRLPALAAVPLLALASIARPELPLLTGAALLTTLLATSPRDRLRDLATWTAAAAWLLLILPHLLHVVGAIGTLRGADSLPGFERSELARLPARISELNTLLTPSLFPLGVPLAAAVALVLRGPGPRRTDWLLLAIALAALAVTIVDLDHANMARVHVPAALFTSILAAAGLSRLWARLRHPAVGAALTAAVILSGAPSLATLFAPTNERTEEQLIRATLDALDATGEPDLMLVRPGSTDRRRDRPGSRFTHFHFPDYLFLPPAREVMLRPVSSFVEAPDFFAPVYFFRGMRCYADFRKRGTAPPSGSDEHPACRQMGERFRLTPIIEWEVPNHGDVWIAYYGDAETLTLGLYRVEPRAGSAGEPGPETHPQPPPADRADTPPPDKETP